MAMPSVAMAMHLVLICMFVSFAELFRSILGENDSGSSSEKLVMTVQPLFTQMGRSVMKKQPQRIVSMTCTPRVSHHRQCVSVHCRTVRNKTGFAASPSARTEHLLYAPIRCLRSNLYRTVFISHNPLVAEVLYVYNAIRGRQLTFLWRLDPLSCGYTWERANRLVSKVRSSP